MVGQAGRLSSIRTSQEERNHGYTALAPTWPARSSLETESTGNQSSGYQNAMGSTDSMEPEDQSGFGFVDTDEFQAGIGIVIFMNTLVLWGETDLPGFSAWVIFDNIFLIIFLIELILRLIHLRFKYHQRLLQRQLKQDEEQLQQQNEASLIWSDVDTWLLLDISVVLLGIFDLWLTPILALFLDAEVGKSEYSSFLRFLRLLRLLRLLRIFKMFSGLFKVFLALKGMGKDFAFIFVVLFTFIFSTAIILTHLLGHGEGLGYREFLEDQYADEFKAIRFHFGDVWSSVFTLFQITTTDNWDEIAIPIIKIDSRWRLFFYGFIMFASWTMISVLTAVASNSMFQQTCDGKDREQEQQEKNRLKFIAFLKESFLAADVDGNGVLDKEEFSALIEKEFVHSQMRKLGIHLTQDELFQAWATLDYDESGELTIDEFVDGLSFLQEGLGTKHIVNVDYSLKRVHARVEARMEKLRAELDEVVQSNTNVISKLKEQGESQHQQQLSFWLWQQWALRNDAYNAHKAAREDSPSSPTKSIATNRSQPKSGQKSAATNQSRPTGR